MLAGAVSYTLMSFGFALFAIPLVASLFGAFFSAVFSWARNNPDVNGAVVPNNIEEIVADVWSTFLPWLIGSIVLGVILWVLGYLSSLWILRSHQVNRPVAVTWSALGIAIVASWLLSALGSPFSGLLNLWMPGLNGPDNFNGTDGLNGLQGIDFAPFVGLGVLFLLIGLILNAAIGLLSWWWMAHAFRARHAEARVPATEPAPTS
jgi:hypothetical protein